MRTAHPARLWTILGFLLLASSQARGGEQEQRKDRDGDPLPERAISRLGSRRLLHADYVTATAFSPDGKKFASSSIDGRK